VPSRTARHTILSEIAPVTNKNEDLRVVVETPKGSRNKYDYYPDCDFMELATVLPEGMTFSYDFGFIPRLSGTTAIRWTSRYYWKLPWCQDASSE
jgi:hypothetical protein